jgi:phosphatidylglycerol:prolipoprotein diacylglycerol transferase
VHPVLTVVRFGEAQLVIGSYGVLLCAAIAIACAGSLRAGRAAGQELGAVIATLGVSIAAGFIGAALLHALAQCARTGSLSALWAPPGLAFYGAALGVAAGLPLCARGFGLSVLAVADRAVPALCLAHAVGRIGCLLGGCCFGAPWDGPFAVHDTDAHVPAALLGAGRHPVAVYEALGLLALGLLFACVRPRRPGSGQRLLAYAAAYSLLRFALEPLRGDGVRGLFFGGALSTSQLVANAVVVGCALLQVWTRRAARTDATFSRPSSA